MYIRCEIPLGCQVVVSGILKTQRSSPNLAYQSIPDSVQTSTIDYK